jgi:hypothetical protein
MKMPSRCFDCTFSKWSNLHQTKACNCGSYYFKPCFEDNSEEFYEKRADFCPLVEVPAPHGRLIDADALLEDVRKNSVSYSEDDFAHEWVDVQPTVIEAEETK